jgi:CMP-N-acetylneuraminic acid synthetase
MIDVALHALEELEKTGYRPDALMILQPTSPLRTPEHIRHSIELLGDNDSVCSVVAVPKGVNPFTLMKAGPDGYLDFVIPEAADITRRQDLPVTYRRDGTIFLTRVSILTGQESFYGKRCVPYQLEPGEALNIDTPEDWRKAEEILRERSGR